MTNEELVKLYQEGNNKALDELVEQNSGIVHKIASKFKIHDNSIDNDDLIQEGILGLIIAAELYNFDNEKRAQFITYAVYWIHQKIYNLVVGHSTREKGNKEFYSNCASLNTPIGEEGEGELQDMISCEDYSFENIEEKMFMQQLHQELECVMNDYLTLFESEVLKCRYGWNNSKPMCRTEIQEIFNLSQYDANKVEFRGLNKLRRTPWARMTMTDWLINGYIG